MHLRFYLLNQFHLDRFKKKSLHKAPETPEFCPFLVQSENFADREDSFAACLMVVEEHFSEEESLPPNQRNYFTCPVCAKNGSNQLQTDLPFFRVTYSFLGPFFSVRVERANCGPVLG